MVPNAGVLPEGESLAELRRKSTRDISVLGSGYQGAIGEWLKVHPQVTVDLACEVDETNKCLQAATRDPTRNEKLAGG